MQTQNKKKALAYVERRRGILPAVYNLVTSGGRSAEETKSLSSQENNNALQPGFNALNNRFEIKTEKVCDEITELRNRITEYNLHATGC